MHDDATTHIQCALGTVHRLAQAAPGSWLHQTDQAHLAVVPAAPHEPKANMGVIMHHPSSETLASVAEIYTSAGITAWSLWVPGQVTDPPPHYHQTTLVAMQVDLAHWTRPAPDVPWRPGTIEELGTVNAAAYRRPALALALATDVEYRCYTIPHQGHAKTVLATAHHGDTCAVDWVATLPEWRKRHLASALITIALRAAKAEGLACAVLQATPQGLAVYTRLDFVPTFDWVVLTQS